MALVGHDRLADIRGRWPRRRIMRWLRTSNAEIRDRALQLARAALRTDEHLLILHRPIADARPPREDAAVVVTAVTRAHLPELAALNAGRAARWKTRIFTDDLDRGYHGFVGHRAGRLVGYYWWVDAAGAAGHRDLERLRLGIVLAPGAVYGYDFFLSDDQRGSRAASDFLDGVEWGLKELGYRDLWGYVASDNRPARWLYAIRGYETVERLTWRTTLGRRRLVAREPVDPVAPRGLTR